MGWKDWSYWLRGGIIGLIIGVPGSLIFLFFLSEIDKSDIIRWGLSGILTLGLIIILVNLILFGIFALMGFIIGKIIEKNLSKWWIIAVILPLIYLLFLPVGYALLIPILIMFVFGFLSIKRPWIEPIFKALIIGIILSIIEILVMFGLGLSGFFGYPGTDSDLFFFGLAIFWLISSLITITISFINKGNM